MLHSLGVGLVQALPLNTSKESCSITDQEGEDEEEFSL